MYIMAPQFHIFGFDLATESSIGSENSNVAGDIKYGRWIYDLMW